MALLMREIESLVMGTLRYLRRERLNDDQRFLEAIEKERGRQFLTDFFSRKPPQKGEIPKR